MASDEAQTARFLPSLRLVTAVILQLAMLITLMIRFNIGTAFLCMVRDPTDNGTAANDADAGEFDWSKSYQSWIVSAYFYAFVVFLVPGGWLVDRFGAQRMLQAGMLVAGVTCLVIPVLTRLHGGLLIAARAVLGATNCLIIPSVPVVSRHWSLSGEYATVFGIAWSGFYLGTAVNFPLGSSLCESSWGWPGVFYVSGGISMVWTALSVLLLQDDPLKSRWLSGVERKSFRRDRAAVGEPEKVTSVPLLKILKNFQVWNVALAFFIGLWNLYASTIALPQFMKTFMKFDLSSNGILSAVPSLLLAVLSIITGRLFTYLNVEKNISKTNCRKGFNFVSNFFPAFLMLASVLLPLEHRTAAVVCLILGIGLTACVFTGGPFSGAADIGPQYTGTIFSIAACVGNVPGFVIPPVLTALTPNDTRGEWVRFVSISVAAHLFSSIYISIFWKSEVQPFAKPRESDTAKDEIKDEAC